MAKNHFQSDDRGGCEIAFLDSIDALLCEIQFALAEPLTEEEEWADYMVWLDNPHGAVPRGRWRAGLPATPAPKLPMLPRNAA